MPNYSKTCIYKICCLDPTITSLYVGSTCNFSRRKYEHKKICYSEKNRNYNMKIYQFIRDNGGWDNWTMIEVAKFVCDSKKRKRKNRI